MLGGAASRVSLLGLVMVVVSTPFAGTASAAQTPQPQRASAALLVQMRNVGPVATPLLRRPTGLTVRVQAPAARVKGRVVVRGPRGFRRLVRRTTKLKVRAGTYTVTALQSSSRAGTAYPVRKKQRIRVARGKRANVTVDYATLVSRRTKVLRARSIRRVTGFAAESATTREQLWPAGGGVGPRLVNDARDSVVLLDGSLEFKKGDILVAGVTSHTPSGLMSRVTAVDRRGDRTAYTVKPVPLSDAVPVGRFANQVRFDAAALEKVATPVGLRRENGCGPSEETRIDVKFGHDVTEMDFDFELDKIHPMHSRMRLEAQGEVSAKVSASANKALGCKGSRLLYEKEFAPKVVMLGPVPVVYQPRLEAKLAGEVKASGAFSSSAEYARSAAAWLQVEGGSVDHGWDLGEPETTVVPFAGAVSAEVTAKVSVKASLVLYGLVGPYAEVAAGPTISSDLTEAWFTAKLGANAGIGVAIDCIEVWGPNVCPKVKVSFDESWTWDILSLTRPQLAPISGGVAGLPYRQVLSTLDGRRGSWERVGTWPEWLKLDGSTIYGTPARAGSTAIRIRFVDADPYLAALPPMNRDFDVLVEVAAGALPEIATHALPGGEATQPYKAVLHTADDRAGTWAITHGALPPGLALVEDRITGTPTTSGTSSFTVSFTDVADRTVTRELRIDIIPRTPPAIATASLPAGEEHVAYGAVLTTVDGRPGVWSLASGSLPPGLELTADGRLQGYPGAAGEFPLALRFTDSEAGRTATRDFTLVLAPDDSSTVPVPRPDGVGLALDPALSSNGRYVVYAAHRPAGSGPCDCSDIWLWDSVGGATVRVSNAQGGGWVDGDSVRPAVSADGETVVFTSDAADLTADSPGTLAIYRWERSTGSTTLLFTLPVPPPGDPEAEAGRVLVSADGSLVFFEVHEGWDSSIHVWDLSTGATTNLTPAPSPWMSNTLQDISTDGRFVAWQSTGVEAPTKVRVYDRVAGQQLAPPRDGEGGQDADDDQTAPVLSPDGRLALFAWFDTWRYDPDKVLRLRLWRPGGGEEATVENVALGEGLRPVDVSATGQVVIASWPGWPAVPSRLDDVNTGESRQLGVAASSAVGMSADGSVVLLSDATQDGSGVLQPGTLTLWRAAP